VRLKLLEISGFRGFPQRYEFDLDAEAVIVVGANGQGKTSLFDAVLWGLTGELPRVGSKHVVSLYSQTGGARVQLELSDRQGETLQVMRSVGEGQDGVRFARGEEQFADDAAETALLSALWPHAVHSRESISALTAATTRSVYLQQDLVREFIEGESHQERFRAVSQLVGAGSVSELTIALDKSKAAWSEATNSQAGVLEEKKRQLHAREAQLDGLASPTGSIDEDLTHNWSLWWQNAGDHGALEGEAPSLDSVEAPRLLDATMKRINAIRAALSRRIVRLEDLADSLAGVPDDLPVDLEQLRDEAADAEEEVVQARRALSAAEAAAAEHRSLQVAHREGVEELRALAEIALRHIDGPCPVCGQSHDVSQTRTRLENAIATSGGHEDPDTETAVAVISEQLSQFEGGQIEAAEALRAAEAERRDRAVSEADLTRRMAELGIESGDQAGAQFEALAEKGRKESAELDAQMEAGERLALELARSGERALRRELEATIEASRVEVRDLEADVEARLRTRDLAGRALEGLRDASAEVVSSQLEQIKPILQRIYRTIDPHPSLRAIDLRPTFSGRRGQLSATLTDPLEAKNVERPDAVLSSSQLNALAVSLFLSLNLGLPHLPLETVMLDDPLQSLDDVNLLGLIDLLRRAKDCRQLIVSTHDRRFSRLLAKKLRPVGANKRTRVIELDGWSRRGPTVTQIDAPSESQALRIAA